MKKCSYCGREYPDESTVCSIDQEPLEADTTPGTPTSEAENANADLATLDEDDEAEVPDGFLCLARLEESDADLILPQLEANGIRFQTQHNETPQAAATSPGEASSLDIYVDQDDYERAGKILALAFYASQAESGQAPAQADSQPEIPEGFVGLAKLDAIDAGRVLGRLETAGIRFLIRKTDEPVVTGSRLRPRDLIEVYVHQDDSDRAAKIAAANVTL